MGCSFVSFNLDFYAHSKKIIIDHDLSRKGQGNQGIWKGALWDALFDLSRFDANLMRFFDRLSKLTMFDVVLRPYRRSAYI